MAKAKAAKSAKKQKAFRIKLVIFIIILIAYGVSVLFFRAPIDRALNIAKYGTADFTNLKDQSGAAVTETKLNSGTLKVHYTDVGQGDACVIELPDGKKMLIDGGKDNQKEKFFTYMENSLPDIKNFDYAILTHSDDDHCGGFDDIIKKFPVKADGRIYRPNQLSKYQSYVDPALSKINTIQGFWDGVQDNAKWDKTTASYKKAIEAMYVSGADVWVTDARKLTAQEAFKGADGNDIKKLDLSGSVYKNSKMDILGDVDGDNKYDEDIDYLITFYAPTQGGWSNVNDYSPIFSLDYQGKRFMFTGDSEADGEKRFAEEYTRETFGKKADVIKLGHHGSSTSTSVKYLDVVMPYDKASVTASNKNDSVLAIVSANQEGNRYGHPHQATLDRLTNEYGVKLDNILRTDTVGTIMLSVNGGDLMYGTMVFVQSESFEPLSWITIGGGIVVIAFVLLFCIRVSKKGKVSVKNNAAAQIAGAAGVNVKETAKPLTKPAQEPLKIAPQYEPKKLPPENKAYLGKTPENKPKPKTTSSSSTAKKKTTTTSDKKEIEKALKEVKKKFDKF